MLSRVPLRIVAGTTVEIRRSLSDYSPLDGWAYSLFLVGPKQLEIEGVPSGSEFEVTLTAAETAALTAGTYRFAERVEHSDGRIFEVGSGMLQVSADLSEAGAGDQRGHARRTLEAIEAVIERRATSDQESYQIQGRALSRTPIADLLKLRQLYREEVRREEQGERFDAGSRVGIRFRKAS